MAERTALIVGAGIGGLAAAISLRRAGWDVRVFERADSPREMGFALNLAANAMVALDELGLAERVAADAHATERVEFRHSDGRVIKRIDLRDAIGRARAVVATRQVLHGALLDAVGVETLRLSSAARGFQNDASGVSLTLASGERVSADVLVGSDGAASVIRRQLHPDEGEPRASGYCAIRGVAYDANHLMGRLSAATYFGTGVEASLAQAGRNALYWYMSLPATDMSARPDVSSLARDVATRLDGLFREVVRSTDASNMRFDLLLDRDPIASWGAGPVTLLGDAAHPMLPYTGQGAAQALEDAVALGLALRQKGDVAVHLRRYERIRSARTATFVARGRRAAAMTTSRSRGVALLRTALIRLVPARQMARLVLLAGEGDPHRDLRSPR